MCKSTALKVAALVNTIDILDTKEFLIMNYFIGSQFARLRGGGHIYVTIPSLVPWPRLSMMNVYLTPW